MARPFTVRTWATPLTIGAFTLIAGTGLLLFFGIDAGVTTGIHRWFSWLFLIGVAGHIAGNFRLLRNHLKTAWGIGSMAFFVTALVISAFMAGSEAEPDPEVSVKDDLIDAPLSSLGAARSSHGLAALGPSADGLLLEWKPLAAVGLLTTPLRPT